MQDHIKFVHEDVTLYQCDACDVKFGFKILLEGHNKILHTAEGSTRLEKIVYDECDKVFSATQTFEDHFLFVHNRLMSHHCPTCDERFRYLNSLTNHLNIRKHDLKPKQFKGDRFDKTFSRGQNL